MKPDFPLQGGAASKHAHAGDQSHEHAHGHAHGHSHPHDHDHGDGTHTHATQPLGSGTASEPRPSLLMSSAPWRLAGAVALIAVLWAAVAWSMAGTP